MSKTREALEAALRDAMKKAFNFGQTYWQQADSHFVSQQNKSEITRESFNKLVNDTVRSALAEPEQEPHKIPIPPAPVDALEVIFAEGWNQCCDAFFGGKSAPEPLVITITQTPKPREWKDLSVHEIVCCVKAGKRTGCESKDMLSIYKAISAALRAKNGG